jgi:hypothetical protein
LDEGPTDRQVALAVGDALILEDRSTKKIVYTRFDLANLTVLHRMVQIHLREVRGGTMRPEKLAVILISLAFSLTVRAADESPKAKSDDEATKIAAPAAPRDAAKPSVEMQIEELRDELQAQIATSRAQEQRIQALESELRVAHAGAPTVTATAERPVEAVVTVEAVAADPQLDQKVEANCG